MKIVLDMNIPEVWEMFLNEAGHESIHWSRIGDIHAIDLERRFIKRDRALARPRRLNDRWFRKR